MDDYTSLEFYPVSRGGQFYTRYTGAPLARRSPSVAVNSTVYCWYNVRVSLLGIASSAASVE